MERMKFYFKFWKQQPKRAALATFGILPVCYFFAGWFYICNPNAWGISMLCLPILLAFGIGMYFTKDLIDL